MGRVGRKRVGGGGKGACYSRVQRQWKALLCELKGIEAMSIATKEGLRDRVLFSDQREVSEAGRCVAGRLVGGQCL